MKRTAKAGAESSGSRCVAVMPKSGGGGSPGTSARPRPPLPGVAGAGPCSEAWLAGGRCEAPVSEAGSAARRSVARRPASHLPNRWRGAAGASLPGNYQPSPQMEMSVSLTGSPCPCHCLRPRRLYLATTLPTATMCSVTAD